MIEKEITMPRPNRPSSSKLWTGLVTATLLLGLGHPTTALAEGNDRNRADRLREKGERIDERLDKRGDFREEKLDRKGERQNKRLDRRGHRAKDRMMRKARRAEK